MSALGGGYRTVHCDGWNSASSSLLRFQNHLDVRLVSAIFTAFASAGLSKRMKTVPHRFPDHRTSRLQSESTVALSGIPVIMSHLRLQTLEMLLTLWLANERMRRSCPCCLISQTNIVRIALQKTP
ncbi:hypothetical protein OUZ56_006320 [Daphnia magna]|uniref:Uncharacterized protein n=1 Tax=Daphnia magna TaxID=35525 RepID=A0ABQ9YVA3_9CRUS|nr:hypothetical protein OUZ56_006320 [Daphnia magna]